MKIFIDVEPNKHIATVLSELAKAFLNKGD